MRAVRQVLDCGPDVGGARGIEGVGRELDEVQIGAHRQDSRRAAAAAEVAAAISALMPVSAAADAAMIAKLTLSSMPCLPV